MTDKKKNKIAGKDTYVRAIRVGYYEGQRRKPTGPMGEPFKLKEGDEIVDWMEEVDAPSVAKAAKVKNAPRNIPEPQKPNGDQQPGDRTGNAELPSTAQAPDQLPPELA